MSGTHSAAPDGVETPRPNWPSKWLNAIGQSLAAAAILIVGPWLANLMVPNENVLNYTFNEIRVGTLAAWRVQVTNTSDVAFSLRISPPDSGISKYAYSPKIGETSTWIGQLTKGKSVDAMYIYEGATTLAQASVEAMITASFQDRNASTGEIEEKPGTLRDLKDGTAWRNSAWWFWCVSPAIVLGIVLALFGGAWKTLPRLWKRIRGK
ncbi:hypothetical protein ACFY89_29080 [Achromobacter spanius]|uniref:hypothetical protein n=1 Tax=Achromobacter spanius TaxID=217203 RepID=UPI0036EF5458